jgi:hypothetical protein
MIKNTMKIIKKIMKRTFAIDAATPETPLNPSNPATIAIIKNIRAHMSIKKTPFFLFNLVYPFCQLLYFTYSN